MDDDLRKNMLDEIERDRVELKPYRDFVRGLTLEQRLKLKKWLGAEQPLAAELRDIYSIVKDCQDHPWMGIEY